MGLKGYVAGFLVSSVLGLGLNLGAAMRATGLRVRPFEWLVSPALAAILAGLCINLLFRVMRDHGVSLSLSMAACTVFGAVEYLAALQAQGIRLRALFRVGADG